jgi:plasmid stabilization system protein ParE
LAERNADLHPKAQRDLEDGLAFYSVRSLIAAERFLSEVEAALDLINEAPDGTAPGCELAQRRE